MIEANRPDAAPGYSDEETIRKLHQALDSAEACLKRMAKCDSGRPNPIDLLLGLRRSVNAQMSGSTRPPP